MRGAPLAIPNRTSNPIGLHNEHSLFQRISIHLHYDVKASKHLASLLERQAGCVAVSFHLDYLYLILSFLLFLCCQLPFCEFPKHATAFHYRYDIQIYCTFVLSVNQHFLGLPASGTHCINADYTALIPSDATVHYRLHSAVCRMKAIETQ
jgi:hypothetical protein